MFGPGPKPGAGRPPGARNKLSRRFLEDVLESWSKEGPAALLEMREDDPSAYCRMVAAILPRELILEERTSGLTAEARERVIGLLREHLVTLDAQQQIKQERQQQLLIDARMEDAGGVN